MAGKTTKRKSLFIISILYFYPDTMSTLREVFFWSGVGILVGTIIVLIIWPGYFGPLAIAALFVAAVMIVLTRPWERRSNSDQHTEGD